MMEGGQRRKGADRGCSDVSFIPKCVVVGGAGQREYIIGLFIAGSQRPK